MRLLKTPILAIDKLDHCHKTNKVRGILCNKCNTGIGQLQHNSKYLRVAAMYCEYT